MKPHELTEAAGLPHKIICPHCKLEGREGGDMTHIENVAVDQHRLIAAITGERVAHADRGEDAAADLGRSGSYIRLAFWCENGHRFIVALTFSHGQVFLTVLENGNWNIENGQPAELWRK